MGLMVACPVALAAPAAVTPFIKIDQFGYGTGMRKVALIVDPQVGANASDAFSPGVGADQYEVRQWSDDAVVWRGTLTAWRSGMTHAQSGDRGWMLDFSAVNTTGSYYLFDSARQVGSGRFEIAPNPYAGVLRQAMRTFFYQRLNHAKEAPFAEAAWRDGAAYEGPGQDRYATSRYAKGNTATARDLSGGWMDAGDTNKYTSFARDAVLALLDAWRFNPAVFGDDFGIPESGNGIADLLDEVRWELDFLKRMQDATGTGGFFLKVGVDNYADISPPSSDTRPRYYVPECTSATTAGAAVLAAAAAVYRQQPALASYAADLLTRAEAAWSRAMATTSSATTFQTDCDDGDVKAGDADKPAEFQRQSLLLAAIYLYEVTAASQYRTFVEARYAGIQPMSDQWWGPYEQPLHVALLRFAGMSGVSPTVAAAIRAQKAAQNDVMSVDDYLAGTDLYRAFLPDPQFHWGHNMVRANVGNLNLDFPAFDINPELATSYREIAHQHLHWLHGANPLGLVMLSNLQGQGAERSLNEIYHTWFADGSVWDNAQTSSAGPAPGYVSGGPNRNYSGPVAGIADQPPQKAYKDWNTGWPENSWEITEPAIYSQAAYVQLLARSMDAPRAPGSDLEAPTAPGQPVASGITATSASLNWAPATDNIGITSYDLRNGNVVLRSGLADPAIALDTLFCGTPYNLNVVARDAAGNVSSASPGLALTTSACPVAANPVFGDALGTDWSDWSWSAVRNFANRSPVKTGTRSIRVDLSAWGALSLRHAGGVPLSSSSTLTFWVYAGATAPLRLTVQRTDTGAEFGATSYTLRAKKWTSITLTRAQLGEPNLAKRLNFQLNGTTPTTLYFDQIQITP